jgi:hypothetical protein
VNLVGTGNRCWFEARMRNGPLGQYREEETGELLYFSVHTAAEPVAAKRHGVYPASVKINNSLAAD